MKVACRGVVIALAGAGGLLVLSSPARAADGEADQCIGDHAEGQVSRSKGELLSARERFSSCAAERCPKMIRDECVAFSTSLEAAVPTVVPSAVDSEARQVGSVVVRIDDGSAAVPVDGRAIALDPGEHRFVFQTGDGRTQTITLTLREAEKSRPIVVRFESEQPAPSKARINPLVFVFGGLGVVAGASFGYFALQGRSDESSIKCEPDCTLPEDRDKIDSMQKNYLIADISLGAAVVSLGVGAYFLIAGSSSAAAPSGTVKRAPSFQLAGRAERDGFGLSAVGRF